MRSYISNATKHNKRAKVRLFILRLPGRKVAGKQWSYGDYTSDFRCKNAPLSLVEGSLELSLKLPLR